MSKFVDYYSDPAIKEIMNAFCDRFEEMFDGFNADGFNIVVTRAKKSQYPVKLHTVGYPTHVFSNGRPYILEVFESWWKDMTQRQKNTAIFHVMCGIPDGAFDEQSKMYGKKLKPEISMYLLEFGACGGVPNWFENPLAKDPMEREADDIAEDVPALLDPDEAIPSAKTATDGEVGDDGIKRVPVTQDDILDVVPEPVAAVS